MKQFLIVAAIVVYVFNGFAQTTQTYNIDSLKRVLRSDIPDTSRIWALNNLARNDTDSENTLEIAGQAIELSQRIGYIKGEAEGYNNLGLWYNQKGNYPFALKYYLKAIELGESVNFVQSLKRSYNSIATVYLYNKDYITAVKYAQKARELCLRLNDRYILSLANSWLARGYLSLRQRDLAIRFANESYEVASDEDHPFALYLATAAMGEVYAAEGDSARSLEFLRKSLGYSKIDGQSFRIAAAHQKLADEFRKLGVKDSSIYHAQKTYTISKSENILATVMSSCLTLSAWHEGIDDKESLRYYKMAMNAQDSLFNQEKSRQVQALSMNEELRQREVEAQRLKAEEERKHNIQYAAIILGLVIFLLLFLLLSHSVVVTQRMIKFFGVLALLILFEFINLVIHPVLGSVTHHSPLLMLIALVCLAAILIPFHHKLEGLIVHRLIEKNKQIRLEAARKEVNMEN